MNLAKMLLKPVVKWAGRRAVVGRNRCRHQPEKGRFTGADVGRIVAAAWRNFDELAPSAPRELTVGSRMNMMLACVTVSFFRALLAAGVEQDYAIELCADAAWQVYAKWGILPRLVARLRTRDPVERMRIPVKMFLRFPFNPPGYRFERLPADDGIAFDITRCPVAEYLRTHGAAALCVGSWCNLDYALSELWGGRLERAGTLAAGDAACRFRFKVAR
jgi:hypothetical protein